MKLKNNCVNLRKLLCIGDYVLLKDQNKGEIIKIEQFSNNQTPLFHIKINKEKIIHISKQDIVKIILIKEQEKECIIDLQTTNIPNNQLISTLNQYL